MYLEDVFADTVRRGWGPRQPAYGVELDRLAVSVTRGDCIAPLILDGDWVYVDPATPAACGDLVSFALSARGAAAQNSALPKGQSPWKKGDRWIKLLAHSHGYDFLLDRHGSAATVTLLGGEFPDAKVPLAPVRNIRRAGRLLFTPDTYASGIGTNAATTVSTTSIASTNLTTTATALMSLTVGPFVVATSVVITVSGYLSMTNTTASLNVTGEMAYAIYTTSGTLPSGHPFFDLPYIPAGTSEGVNFTYEQTFSLAAATTKTYYFNAAQTIIDDNQITVESMAMKAECIHR